MNEEKKEGNKINEQEQQQPSLKEILTGRISKDFLLKKWVPVMTIFVFTFIFLAYLLIPPYEDGKYNWWIDTISGLGDYIENPYGWWGFTIAILLSGILFLTVIQYMYRRLSKIAPWVSRFSTFFLLIGAIGMFIIAFLTDTNNGDWIGDLSMSKIHTNLATVTFGAFGVGIFMYWLAFAKDESPRLGGKQEMNYWREVTVPYLIMFSVALGLGISQLIRAIKGWGWKEDPGTGMLELMTRFQFWEWMLLFTFFVFFYMILYCIPEKIEKYD
ncbi:MAG: hypothetical protein GF364_22340 [Candidatus Lokiarchaeota archaeon]|nr:hypothetical protein [Candidatus Lokiarchaeota archaeon]